MEKETETAVMEPPTLSKNSAAFLKPLKEKMKEAIDGGDASTYFCLYGFTDLTISSQTFKDVQWTLEDFAYFYDSPAYAKAWSEFRTQYLDTEPWALLESWDRVAMALSMLNRFPEQIPPYAGKEEADKSQWGQLDYICWFIYRLLNNRSHIENGTAESRDDFETQQAAYAQSFGRDNRFYGVWNDSDRWVAMYLLYCKLLWEQEQYVKEKYGGSDIPELTDEVSEAIANDTAHTIVEEAYGEMSKTLTADGKRKREESSKKGGKSEQRTWAGLRFFGLGRGPPRPTKKAKKTGGGAKTDAAVEEVKEDEGTCGSSTCVWSSMGLLLLWILFPITGFPFKLNAKPKKKTTCKKTKPDTAAKKDYDAKKPPKKGKTPKKTTTSAQSQWSGLGLLKFWDLSPAQNTIATDEDEDEDEAQQDDTEAKTDATANENDKKKEVEDDAAKT
ncbi:uncharacterized protein GGS25DRAFT_525525 [Hypoxylon fragiforme]|uniref:uncharacterized protein n=1 Tax=Hypoxylon fragiforme TaxID=63214 RepID=UPI0020C5CED1|nr:uncharacterized protein GGS25DRAFT_525525 [Hypoxylon fragiforme]KAI2604247.1 hypothetical protein GGS25DRAFT_525525 [Hypoxylon fragiforme]